jgi:homoserine dehydrogenase
MSQPLKIAIAGLGTVGAGTVQILTAHEDMIAARCGRSIKITAVSARNRDKDRGIDLSPYAWFEDPSWPLRQMLMLLLNLLAVRQGLHWT